MPVEPWEERFSRQILVDGIGYQGQAAIRAARVRVAGPPPWAELAARYLAAAGFELTGVIAAGALEAEVGTGSLSRRIAAGAAGGLGAGMQAVAGLVLAVMRTVLEPTTEEEHGAGPGADCPGATE